jgi:hypothetical protein
MASSVSILRRNSLICFYYLFVLLAWTTNSQAYYPNTHQEMSLMAFNRSVLNINIELFDDLDLDSSDDFPNSRNEQRTVLELIRDGSKFEDAILAGEVGVGNGGENLRMKHHFYSTQQGGSALYDPTISLFLNTYSSTDWALEDQGEISSQNFSLKDGYDNYRKAVTKKLLNSRPFYWGKTFQTLGHVIHHIQDMAQPQHTRNDVHAPFSNAERKTYEKYTERKRVARGLPYTGYPNINLSKFNTAKSFWDGTASNGNDGFGLAEFSSTNFVSAGTNYYGGSVSNGFVLGAQVYSDPDLPLPSANNLPIIISVATDPNLELPGLYDGNIHFIGTQVTDSYISAKSQFNLKTSSFSLFDSDLNGISSDLVYHLHRSNYDAAHEYLIPRAVSYSAGLINYFFRGRIKAKVTADGDSIEITNTSNEGIADPMSPTTFQAGGAFEVFYETSTGQREPLLSLQNLALGSSLPVNGTHTITGLSAALQGITGLCDRRKIIILFDGNIGTEMGLATTNLKVPPGVSLAAYNNTYKWGGWSPTNWVSPSRLDISNTEGTDLADCGSKYYMFANPAGSGLVYQFDLNPANTIKPLIYTGKAFSPGLIYSGYLRMSNDGIYMILESRHVLYKYALTTPFDVTTAVRAGGSYAPGYAVSGFDTSVDGTKLYLATTSGDQIIEYSMSPAWDITSLAQTGNSISVVNEIGERNITDVKMSTSGTMMLAIGGSSLNVSGVASRYDKVYGYDLTTAFDLGAASYSEVLTTVVYSDESRSIAGEYLENLFMIWEFDDNLIYQYDAPH